VTPAQRQAYCAGPLAGAEAKVLRGKLLGAHGVVKLRLAGVPARHGAHPHIKNDKA
jgi:hypothetical protein